MERRVVFDGKLLPYLLVAPQMIVTLVFFFWPSGQAVYQSLVIEDAFGGNTKFVWFENFTALFHDGASFVNRFVHYARGVDEIVAMHRPVHETIYRDSTLENQLIAVDLVTDDVAIVQFWSRLSTGPAQPAGCLPS